MIQAGAEDVIICEIDGAQISYAKKNLEAYRTWNRETMTTPITINASLMLVDVNKSFAYDPEDYTTAYLPPAEVFQMLDPQYRGMYDKLYGGAAKLKVRKDAF